VRLTRVEAGPTPTAQAGEWGRIRHITDRGGLEIVLTGYSRPRGVALAMVRDFPATNVIPCDHRGLALDLPNWSNWREAKATGSGSRKNRI